MGNTESSREELSRTKGSGESMSSLRAFATKTDSPADWSSYELRDSDIEFQLESEDGQKRLNALKESVGTELREKYPELVDFICVSSLVFRNGDMKTASDRVQNYLNWRYKYLGTYEKIILANEPDILELYGRNMFTVIEDVDAEGRCAIYLRLKFMDPTKISPLAVLKTFHYSVMSRILKDHPVCQKKGIYLIGDMGDAGFSNMDQRVPKAIMGAISKNFPVRLQGIYMVRPIWLMNLLFPIIRLFLPEKLQKRIKIIGNDPKLLKDHGLFMSKLPEVLGGTNTTFDFHSTYKRWMEEEKDLVAPSDKKGEAAPPKQGEE